MELSTTARNRSLEATHSEVSIERLLSELGTVPAKWFPCRFLEWG